MIASVETFVRAIRFSVASDDSSELITTSEPCKFSFNRFGGRTGKSSEKMPQGRIRWSESKKRNNKGAAVTKSERRHGNRKEEKTTARHEKEKENDDEHTNNEDGLRDVRNKLQGKGSKGGEERWGCLMTENCK